MIKLPVRPSGIVVFLLLIFTLSFNANAQSDFKPGFIITTQMDTIYGVINTKTSTSLACHFKKTPDSNLEIYQPNEIHSYRIVNGRYYISMTVPVRNSNVIIQDIDFDQQNRNGKIENVRFSDSTTTQKKLFAEYLLNGIIKVYYVRDNHLDLYFIRTQTNRLVELKVDKIETMHNGMVYAVNERSSYKGLLMSILAEDPSLKKTIDKMHLEHHSVIEIGKKYHDFVCKDGKCIIYQKDVAPLTIDYILHIGYQNCLTNPNHILTGNFISFPSFKYGVEFVTNNLLHDRENIGFKITVDYWRSKLEDKNTPLSRFPGWGTLTYTFSNISIDIDGVYKLSSTPKHWFIDAGLTTCLSFATKYTLSDGSSTLNTYTKGYDPFNFLKIGGNGALGYQFPVSRKGNYLSVKLAHTQFTNFSTTGIFVGYTIR